MSTNLKILEDDYPTWLFNSRPYGLRRQYNPDYSLVICHALQNYLEASEKRGIVGAKTLLKDINSFLYSKEPHICREDFIEIYRFQSESGKGSEEKPETGFVVIDRSKYCYPLVLYPDDDNTEHGDRVWGFRKAIESTTKKIDKVFPLLAEKKEWDPEFQKRLAQNVCSD